ncbi:MAG: ArsA family ATPase [Pyrinomonadaceae bacterium]|nr:ArsA family ATPase [Pyrinomonadaceae bacterium]
MKKLAAASLRQKRRASASISSQPSASTLPQTRYLFFGGKGGVGKTSAAASTALYLLDHAGKPDERILLFSTDPAHSLSDSLNVKVGDQLTEVAHSRRGAQLFAYEMDASAALEKFKTEHRAVIQEIAERGTLLDESDINELLNLSLPGMDEVMALFELSELDRAGDFSRIVVDTAPSGHTSRLLRLPETFLHMIRALDLMAEKHRYMVSQFVRGGRRAADSVDVFLSDLTERIERVRAMLYDKSRASFMLVLIPEAMSVEETERYYELLLEEKIPVTDIIINRAEREHDDCPYCHARARSQQAWLREIKKKFKALSAHTVPLMPVEVRCLAALRRFGRIVWEEETEKERRAVASKKKPGIHAVAQDESERRFHLEPRRLLIFGGKGGVGKTTAASAAALALAEEKREARVLIFSTDPAHSLSDSFNEEVGEMRKGLAGRANLDGMEINPAARFEELKTRYRAWTDELFASLTGNSRWEIQFDREAMRELVALAPPGIDEIAALSAIADLLGEGGYETIVLDTAPTGHLVRFLELPDVVLSWVRAFLKLLLKYREVVRASGVAEELIALSKSIKRVNALLTDARECEFIGVSIPERMSLEETVRLAESLKRLRVPMRRLLINGLVPEEAAHACDFCAARLREQTRVLKEFRRRLGHEVELFISPQHPQEVRGRKRLKEHFAGWQLLADF